MSKNETGKTGLKGQKPSNVFSNAYIKNMMWENEDADPYKE